jgi:flagellar hook protein FlgE
MTFMSSFGTGVAALMAQSTAMDAISQNIANLRTNGYKRADTGFSSLLQGIDTNPYKPGGVAPQVRRLVDVEGMLEKSSRPLDIAIAGKGMFVYSSETTGAGDLFFSRKGEMKAVGVESGVADNGYLSAFEDLYLMAWPVDFNGAAVGTSAADMVAIPASFDAPYPGQATTTASISMIIPASGSTNETVDIFVYDSAGQRQTRYLDWTNTGTNTWDLEILDAAGASLGAPTSVSFDGEGNILPPSTISAAGLTLDLSNVTQRGDVLFKGLYLQDGIGTGSFVSYEVGESGLISARFTSGAITPLYQLPLALFGNTNGLVEYPDSLWGVSESSGGAQFVAAGTTAKIAAGANELSNVDLADSFSQMIVTQRAYSSAAQLIQTADEMMQTIRDLR